MATEPGISGCWDTSSHNAHDSYRLSGGAYTAANCDVLETDTGEVTLSDLRTVCCTGS